MARYSLKTFLLLLFVFTKRTDSRSENEVCRDRSSSLCYRYREDCEINKNVKRICPKTCKTCRDETPKHTTDPKETCFDHDEDNCERWKGESRCGQVRLQTIMRKLCARTCGFCTPLIKPTKRPTCQDRDKRNCKRWKNQGRCQLSYLKQHMKRECQNTCGYCKNDRTETRSNCYSRPCLNGATCYNMPSSRLGYTCSCRSGWTGIKCEKKICKDRERRQCKSWKWWGYCDSYNKERKARAHAFCAKTCGVCK